MCLYSMVMCFVNQVFGLWFLNIDAKVVPRSDSHCVVRVILYIVPVKPCDDTSTTTG